MLLFKKTQIKNEINIKEPFIDKTLDGSSYRGVIWFSNPRLMSRVFKQKRHQPNEHKNNCVHFDENKIIIFEKKRRAK